MAETFDALGVASLESSFRVDVFILKARAFEAQELANRVMQAVGAAGRRLAVARPEDVLGLLEVQRGRLDLLHVRRWCAELGLADLLARAERESA